jgi:hypothetical protein
MTNEKDPGRTRRTATASGQMKRFFWTALLAAVAVSVTLAAESGGAGDDNEREGRDGRMYAIGLWGDLPYSTEQEAGVAKLIEDMNRHDLAFSVHDGDLKTGNGAPECTDALYLNALDTLNSLKAPAMFTPGDNDWTDCDRPKNGKWNSLGRLSYERLVLFNDSYSFGKRRLRQEVQATPLCLGSSAGQGDAAIADRTTFEEPCSENRRWTVGGVTYATLNVQGSCNNLCGDQSFTLEYERRNEANIQWMRDTFDEASRRQSVAVMFISQADPGFSESEFDAPQRNPTTLAQTDGDPDGFQQFLLALRAEVIAFGRPVAYVHGDSHYFRIDRPLLDVNGLRIQNFTRIETFGDHADNGTNDVQWVKALVDPGTPEVFAFQPQIVSANLKPYLAELPAP